MSDLLDSTYTQRNLQLLSRSPPLVLIRLFWTTFLTHELTWV